MQDSEIIIHTTNGLHVRVAATLIAKLSITTKVTRILQKIFISYKIKKGDKVSIQFEEEVSTTIIEIIKIYLEEEKVNYMVEEKLYGIILTMNLFHEIQSLLDQSTLEKKRIKYLENEFSEYKKLNDSFADIIGCSDTLMKTLFVTNKVAKSDSTILITGESGTGKELIAKGIHKAGFRKDKPFIRVNCEAISLNLIESELFGHEKEYSLEHFT